MSSPAEPLAKTRRKAPKSALARLVSDPLGLAGLVLIVLTVSAALLADFALWDPAKLNPVNRFMAPTGLHWLGTDNLGRDLFSRVVHGARIALAISIGATALSLIVGLVLGILAGFGPRWLDSVLLLVMDAMNSIPTVMLALLLITYTGPSLWAVVLVVVLVNGPGYARITRTHVLALRSADFIEAERAIGARFPRIVFFHVLPNILGPLLILAAMDIPIVIGIEAGLSFLGMGVRPPTPSWGTILFDGFSYIRDSVWMVVAGGLPIVVTALGFTFLGEALRDTFDPKLAKR
ncbi:ABC transporter permease [Xinfangfangia sp. CPCC 101601]|uniref:ABC transporter permease n=1 Tax=Pseudogemmobacter lacusdianii TaxID=3069608 RepID=A0ABU0VUA0_9RHOB|nr:ABC transporter permease [Xinfangfangia sp. CPCC 101601]MDQ2065128.1 ABC transporter permease [Xinfangfangia sp. CPCC 101601]